MLPDEERLLRGMRTAVSGLTSTATPSDMVALDAIDATLIELLLRRDRRFYIDHYTAGLELVRAGDVLATKMTPGTRASLGAELNELKAIDDVALPAELTWDHVEQLRGAL